MKRAFTLLILLAAQPVLAAPKVMVTIPVLTGIVADLTAGISEPSGLMDASAEPHEFSLLPSQLASIGEADMIIALGLGFEPWLEPAVNALESGSKVIYLEEPNPSLLFARNFDLSPSAEQDPHLWLDPASAIPWILLISQSLIAADPTNTDTYRSNEIALLQEVSAAKEALETLGERLQLAEVQLIVSHDAYQYLERRLGMSTVGMLSDQHDVKAGARSLSKIYRTQGTVCLIEHPKSLLPEDLFPNAPRTSIDPMGAGIEVSAEFTSRYYAGIKSALETCLNQPEE